MVSHAPLWLRVTAWCFWSLSKGVTSLNQPISKAVGAVLHGPECSECPPASLGHEHAQCAPHRGFYFLLLTRLTTVKILPTPQVLLKNLLARVGFGASVFKSPLRMQARVLPLWSWMAGLYLLVGRLLLCVNTGVGVLCMTACLSHWFHQYDFVIVCLCDWVSVHFRAPVYWVMMSGIGLFDWVMASFESCKWMCPSPVSLSRLGQDHLHWVIP